MKTSDFYYELPKELIAQFPMAERSASKLLVYDRKKRKIEDRIFSDIIEYLKPGDVLVRNDTRVIPARIYSHREETGGAMEFLLLKRLEDKRWECLAKPGKRAKPGYRFKVSDELSVIVVGVLEDGNRVIDLEYDGILEEILERVGEMPLPPYITEKLEDNNRYQTVYAHESGSAAAPTAGLHFTDELFERISDRGVEIANVLLHVGLGTFRPVSVANVEEHRMHSEYYRCTEDSAAKINAARARGGRIIAVGTTSCRTLESITDDNGIVHAGSGMTDIFITPGYKFKAVDALITNFHLPESTLLMLISAFSTREEIMNIYEYAVRERYRFFSFGDAMFIY